MPYPEVTFRRWRRKMEARDHLNPDLSPAQLHQLADEWQQAKREQPSLEMISWASDHGMTVDQLRWQEKRVANKKRRVARSATTKLSLVREWEEFRKQNPCSSRLQWCKDRGLPYGSLG